MNDLVRMARECLRVDQIDANILDEEYRQAAIDQLETTLESLPVTVSRQVERVRPEIELAIDSVLWSTRLADGASPGQLEEDISYKDYSREKVAIHYGLWIVVPYLARRLPQLTNSPRWARAFTKIEAIWEAVSIIHYLRFLRKGGFSTPLESVLGLRNWNNDLPTIGTVNYESQNRELLWHAFRDALLLGWPLAHGLRRFWEKRTRAIARERNPSECGACGRDAIVPVRWTSCAHVACYWCDASRKERECVVCGQPGEAEVVKGRRLLS